MTVAVTYLLYLVISIGLTVFVGHALSRSGRAFLLDVFGGNDSVAEAVNRLLVVGFYLLNLGFVTLSDVSQGNSGEVILMNLLGGSGTFLGPVVGANLVVTLQEYLSDVVGAWVSVIIGAIFVVCVLIFRRGFVGEIQRRFAQRAA